MTSSHLGTVTNYQPGRTVELTADTINMQIPREMTSAAAERPDSHPALGSVIKYMDRYLALLKISIKDTGGEMAEVVYHYELVNGRDPPEETDAGGTGRIDSAITYELTAVERTLSILQHPRFKDITTSSTYRVTSGSEEDYLTDLQLAALIIQEGAIDPVDQRNRFEYFSATTYAQILREYLQKGRLSWRAFIPVFTRTESNARFPTSMKGVGSIDNPDGPAPELDEEDNWLFAGLRSTKRVGGTGSTNVTTWEASEPGGWVRGLYGKSSLKRRASQE